MALDRVDPLSRQRNQIVLKRVRIQANDGVGILRRRQRQVVYVRL